MKTKTFYISMLSALFFAATLPGLVSWRSTPLEAQPQTLSSAFSPEDNSTIKYRESTLIQTDNPTAVMKAVKQEKLRLEEVATSPDGSTVMTIATDNTSKVKSAIADIPHTIVAKNQRYRAVSHVAPNDTHYASQWNLSKIKAPAAWDETTGTSSTVLAVIDSGMLFSQTVNGTTFSQPDLPTDRQWNNPGEADDLATNGVDDDDNGLVDDWRGWDFMGGYSGDTDCPNHDPGEPAGTYIDGDNDPQPYSCDSPLHPTELNKTHYNSTCTAFVSACFVGHGTVVGSTAAAETNNNTLVAGIDHNVTLMNLRALDGYGFTDSNIVTQAVRYATANGADVINLSLATSDCDGETSDPILEDALSDAAAAGVVIVAAAGNEGSNNICYPASSSHAIAVGASDQSDQKVSFSNTGSALDVVAPGTGIPAANAPSNARPSNYHPSAAGTSVATPHVAGLASLIKAIKPNATAAETFNFIVNGADRTSGMGKAVKTSQYGYGRINAQHSAWLAQGKTPVYRLYNSQVKNHFLTAKASERNTIAGKGYGYEGITFWSHPSDTVPVYRLYSTKLTNHFYTTKASERDAAISQHGYKYEGIKFHATAGGNVPIYRLYSSSATNHLYTPKIAERDAAAQGGYKKEGTAFTMTNP